MLSVRARALRLLALREHSRAELERKLYARGQAAAAARDPGTSAPGGRDADAEDSASAELQAEVRRVLDELEQAGLLSDRRTADALIQAKASRYGVRRLGQMLRAKSLDDELVRRTLGAAQASEYERASEVWRRRFGQPPHDLRERGRQQRFLAGRGFEPSVVERVLKEAGQGADPAADG